MELGDVSLSLPSIVNRGGIARVLSVPLNGSERKALEASAEVHHVDSLEVNFAMSWSDAKKVPFMCTEVCLVSDHAIAIDELPMDLWVKIRECVPNISVELTHAGFVGRHVWLRCVVDEVVREKLFENIKSSFSLNLFGIAAHHGFGCVRRCHCSHAF
jgi:hypothetical protein